MALRRFPGRVTYAYPNGRWWRGLPKPWITSPYMPPRAASLGEPPGDGEEELIPLVLNRP